MNSNIAFALMLPIYVVGILVGIYLVVSWLLWLVFGLQTINAETPPPKFYWLWVSLWVLSWYVTIAGIGYGWRVYG